MSDSLKDPSVEEEVRQGLLFGPFFPLLVLVMDFLWLLSQNVLRRCKGGNYGMLFIKGKRYVIKGNWDASYCFAFKEEVL